MTSTPTINPNDSIWHNYIVPAVVGGATILAGKVASKIVKEAKELLPVIFDKALTKLQHLSKETLTATSLLIVGTAASLYLGINPAIVSPAAAVCCTIIFAELYQKCKRSQQLKSEFNQFDADIYKGLGQISLAKSIAKEFYIKHGSNAFSTEMRKELIQSTKTHEKNGSEGFSRMVASQLDKLQEKIDPKYRSKWPQGRMRLAIDPNRVGQSSQDSDSD